MLSIKMSAQFFFLCEVIEINSRNRWCLHNSIDTNLLVVYALLAQDESWISELDDYFSTTH